MVQCPKTFFFTKCLPLFLTFMALSGCVKMAPLHYGTVMDAEHHLPLPQTEVFIRIYYDCFNPLWVAGGPSYYLPERWVMTDDNGEFFVPPKLYPVNHSICWSTKTITYTRPGYFSVEKDELNHEIFMDIWTHSSNSRYFKLKSDDRIYRDRPPMTPAELEKLGFMQTDEQGVFFRRPGARFTKIYGNFKGISFLDDASGEWITLDHRGKAVKAFFDPAATMTQNPPSSQSLFTDGEKIFIQHLENINWRNKNYECVLSYSKGEIETIEPHKGKVLLVSATDGGNRIPRGSSFLTIEDEGRIICHYGRSLGLSWNYDLESSEKFCDVRFFRGYDASVLPKSNLAIMRQNPNLPLNRSNIDPKIDETRFVDLIRIDGLRYLVLTRTPSFWHIYQMEWFRDLKTKKMETVFVDLACFSRDREILDWTREGYISFKNEGLRKFDLEDNYYIDNKKIFENSHEAITSDLIKIHVGYGGYGQSHYVYAVSGEDRIYRFSLDGIPDYPISLKPGLQIALAPSLDAPATDKIIVCKQYHPSARPFIASETIPPPGPFGHQTPQENPLPLVEAVAYTPSEKDFITNSVGMTFVYIPPGQFLMGSRDEIQRRSVENPRPAAIEKGFYLQTTEVTQWQWKAVMGNSPSWFKKCGWSCPVENISWYDAQEFIGWLNRMENTDKYRLPTETEWEYACRAGTGTHFSFGDCLSQDQANFRPDGISPHPLDCGNGENRKQPIPVASLGKNAWGLYDMHGNIAEWCQDQTPLGNKRMVRGGSWGSPPFNCRSAFRGEDGPKKKDSCIGFRVMRDP